MKWIGLTGGIATGKTSFSNQLRQRGFKVIDADQIAAEVVASGSKGLKQIEQHFGPGVLTLSGELDRTKLAQTVFHDKNKLQILENIIHPLVQKRVTELKSEYQQTGESFVFYDVPLLYEKNIGGFDAVVLVYSPEAEQRKRLQAKSMPQDQIDKRIEAQLPIEEKKSKADFIVNNMGSIQDLEHACEQLIKSLKNKWPKEV